MSTKNYHVVVAEEKTNANIEEKSSDKWEGYNKWGGWQRYRNLDYIKEAVVTICRKDLYDF